MIAVVNKRSYAAQGHPWEIYIGRPSPLGNPYNATEYGREECIEMFKDDLQCALSGDVTREMTKTEIAMRNEFERLVALYRTHKKLVLICWCAPLKCHGDVIARFIENITQ